MATERVDKAPPPAPRNPDEGCFGLVVLALAVVSLVAAVLTA